MRYSSAARSVQEERIAQQAQEHRLLCSGSICLHSPRDVSTELYPHDLLVPAHSLAAAGLGLRTVVKISLARSSVSTCVDNRQRICRMPEAEDPAPTSSSCERSESVSKCGVHMERWAFGGVKIESFAGHVMAHAGKTCDFSLAMVVMFGVSLGDRRAH
ncbi:hypothetical protein MPTK1_6g18670 [Marchantia polymorpha subsp. ruderalis]|uniref:Uncharacterized protein n=2 Tax=Marchantia polymorpha TaxID=3197 RepID=A0AAF6BTI5_MARPO|nr:hypothetical protein MARPO_0038s0077 [Marchantia polymorpha]BBN15319.1 hypothetical protein Mp_6g18670 [Marchantia polymorpha subsp. ruderalis]|eukprot:PTQ40752.1 hypothetical protein MARPO_0038s0077 [Marchantia polymorpha]